MEDVIEKAIDALTRFGKANIQVITERKEHISSPFNGSNVDSVNEKSACASKKSQHCKSKKKREGKGRLPTRSK